MIEPLDLETLFVYTLSGSMEIFMIIMAIALVSLAAKFKLKNSIFAMLFVIFGLFMAAVGINWIVLLSTVLGGLLIYLSLTKLMQ